ncbi:MAG: hypothetical protein ACOC0B_02905 [bacterium]
MIRRVERWESGAVRPRLARDHIQYRLARRKAGRLQAVPQTREDADRYQAMRRLSRGSPRRLRLTVVETERLDPDAPDHETVSVTFEGRGAPPVLPNDYVSIRWENDPELVEEALEMLGESPERLVRVGGFSSAMYPGSIETISLREVLRSRIELQTLSSPLLERYGFHEYRKHNDAEQRRYKLYRQQARGEVSPGDTSYRPDYCSVSMLSLLKHLKETSHMPPSRELLPPQERIFGRSYTISGFRRGDDGRFRMSITVSVVSKEIYTVEGARESARGRASSFVARLRPGDRVDGFILPDRHMFPQSLDRDVPLIVVCTGAGISGPLSLLRSGYHGGPLWVIYGVRNWRDHHLYGPELKHYLDSGVIDRLDIAESRPTSPEVSTRYVQDVLNADAHSVVSWLRDGAHMFLGGRLSMGIAVNRSVRDALVAEGQCSGRDEADACLRQWYDRLRFQAAVSRV